jgi:DNA-binding transcriptional LysR family regulator
VLTPEGAALESHVRQLRLSLDDVVREIADLSTGRAGQVRLGAAPGVVEDLLLRTCSAFVQEAPYATLTVIVAAIDTLRPALCRGELDLILSGMPTPPVENAVHEPLLVDELVVFASARHRLAQRTRVTVAELTDERWAMTVVNAQEPSLPRKALEENGIHEPRIAMKTSYLPLRDQVVACSDLLGVSSRRLLRQIAGRLDLVELPVPELARTRHVAITYRKNAYLSTAAQRLIALLKKTAAELKSQEGSHG